MKVNDKKKVVFLYFMVVLYHNGAWEMIAQFLIHCHQMQNSGQYSTVFYLKRLQAEILLKTLQCFQSK